MLENEAIPEETAVKEDKKAARAQKRDEKKATAAKKLAEKKEKAAAAKAAKAAEKEAAKKEAAKKNGETPEKKANSASAKKGIHSIGVQIMALSIGLLFVAAVILNIYSVNTMRSEMEKESLDGLENVAMTISANLEKIDPGDFHVEIGVLKKGDAAIGESEDFLDSFVEGKDVALTIFYGDVRYLTTIKDAGGSRVVGTTCTEEVRVNVLDQGKHFTATDVVINGEPYYAAYVPIIADDGSVDGMVFAGEKSAEVNAMIAQKSVTQSVITILMCALGAIISIFFTRAMIRPINAVRGNLEQMAQGDMNIVMQPAALKRKDEVGDMARALDSTIAELRNVIGEIGKIAADLLVAGDELEATSAQTSNTADEISRAIEDVSKGAIAQAEDIEVATAKVSEMGEGITMIAESVGNLNRSADSMMDADDASEEIIKDLARSNDRTTQAIRDVSSKVNATDESVGKIQEAVTLIASIASETNLLSLNASIEAARAGEAGRGFAVVASEIKKLAEESNASADRIAQIIQQLSADSRATVAVMQEMEEIVAQQQEKLDETRAKFSEVSEGIRVTIEEADLIRANTDTCNGSRAQVVDVIQNLSAISEENAASTEETTAAMQELNATVNLVAQSAKNLQKVATELEQNIRFFRL